jgi:hypothetical protein
MSKLSPGEVESLSQLRKVSGTGGFKLLTGTGAHPSLTGYAIVANTDTVFADFKIDGVDSMAKLGLALQTIKAGAYLPVSEGQAITDIQLTSGDCLIYNL